MLIDPWIDPQRVLLVKEQQDLVRKALATLSPDHREVITLCDLQELSYQEIVEITGRSLGAVKSLLYRARLALREALKPYVEGDRESQ